MVLDSFNNVALAFELKQFFSNDDVVVIDLISNAPELALVLVQVGRVTEGALIVRHRPCRG